jgi:hypothetical protein
MKKLTFLLISCGLAFAGCERDDDDVDDAITPAPIINEDNSRGFKVLIENVSNHTTLQEGAMPDRTAPLSHGVWAIMSSGDMFTVNQPADEGTSRIAEDGFTTVKTNELNNRTDVVTNGEFVAPGGPDNGAAIFVGESSMFMVKAKPGEKLQIMTMFVQSNDWFYSFSGGLPLFNADGSPISGDVTTKLVLYDAGTEYDEPLGLGVHQKPDQDPLAANVGPDDPVNMVKEAAWKHPQFVIPPITSVIRVTVTPE